MCPENGPLESVCIDILRERICTPGGNRYLIVILDRFTKLVRTIPTNTISSVEIAKHLFHYCIFHCGPPVDSIADNGKQLMSKFFRDVCRTLNGHNIYSTTYHQQTNGQGERFNRTIVSALRTYIADHPKNWYMYTDELTYANNYQPRTFTAAAPFELGLPRPHHQRQRKPNTRKCNKPRTSKENGKQVSNKSCLMTEKDSWKHKQGIIIITITNFVGTKR